MILYFSSLIKCGKPVVLSKCACGVRIGGQEHKPVEGFIEARGIPDMTRPGHILGHAENRSEAPNRNLTSAQSCVLHLCLHLAMLQGAIHHQQVKKFEATLKVHLIPADKCCIACQLPLST